MATFTLDDFKIERPEEQFEYKAKSGNVYVFVDPKSLKGRDLLRLDLNDPELALMTLLGEQYDAFMDEPEVDGYLLDPLLRAWSKHYGNDVDPGNGRASTASSPGTRRR